MSFLNKLMSPYKPQGRKNVANLDTQTSTEAKSLPDLIEEEAHVNNHSEPEPSDSNQAEEIADTNQQPSLIPENITALAPSMLESFIITDDGDSHEPSSSPLTALQPAGGSSGSLDDSRRCENDSSEPNDRNPSSTDEDNFEMVSREELLDDKDVAKAPVTPEFPVTSATPIEEPSVVVPMDIIVAETAEDIVHEELSSDHEPLSKPVLSNLQELVSSPSDTSPSDISIPAVTTPDPTSLAELSELSSDSGVKIVQPAPVPIPATRSTVQPVPHSGFGELTSAKVLMPAFCIGLVVSPSLTFLLGLIAIVLNFLSRGKCSDKVPRA